MSKRAAAIRLTFNEVLDEAEGLGEKKKQWVKERWIHEAVSMYEKSVSAERLHGATTLIGVLLRLLLP
jgi:hypothetical protein